ncbi:SDR family NAD(P)-dependent oxidoreductase [Allosaccharopolyspora coralli]|uniref:SDR family NAD(P)-dependent oxidoreductase n=1 Tax=Allosaccharopolyspora coralli TaxID=2665642 RepID=A0A5Q3Q7V9_9PSEU|nr:SDR family oxidoreductase [Allosaccharopolyspora coralli]QGK70761.1 SDR family NAD(P)-dependent oxidoreductase [Allosaccharopolyspora coralli]
MSNIDGKVVAITGASSGLGEATARLLAERGARVFLGARRKENLDEVAESIRSDGGEVDVHTVDVTRKDQVEDFVSAAVGRFGRVDVLVNNAGLMPLAPLDATKVDEWEQMVDVNIKGVLYGIAATLPRMREQGSGHVITLSSVAGHVVFPNSAVYSGTKYAVRAISEGLRQEAGENIRTTIISPGAVQSELTQTISHEETAESVAHLYASAIDSGAVARAIAYAIDEPGEVDINEIVLRPTAQAL